MNSSQIEHSLKGYKDFVGVFPCDLLPQLEPGQAMIVNTDPHNEPGEHWVAFYKSHAGCLEYFDSFGMPPLVPILRKYINMSAHYNFTYSTVHLQHESAQTCGNYCIAYVKHRLLNQPFVTLLSHFSSSSSSSSLSNNDRKVYGATQ